MGAWTSSGYPWTIVRLSRDLCPRLGQYKLARLAAKYGPEIELDDLVVRLSLDCPRRHDRKTGYEDGCGARLMDLERRPPPDLPPMMMKLRVIRGGRS